MEKFKSRLKRDELEGKTRTERSLDKLETEVKLQVQKSRIGNGANDELPNISGSADASS